MNPTQPVRIMIVDDHPIVRDGLAAIMEHCEDLVVVGEAADGREAARLFQERRPDVTLMDLRMPVADGFTAIASIREISPQARIIVLTTYDGDQDIYRALRAGAKAYLLKDAARSELLDTIRQVAQGKTCLPSPIAAILAQRMNKPELTARELEVLNYIANGCSNLEIANKLFIAEGTVKAHVNSVLRKMSVNDRTSAVTQALQRGLIQLT